MVFTVLLAVVVCYWIVVLAGGLDTDTDGGLDGNLLKLASLRDRLTPSQAARREAVKMAYLREKALGGSGDDPMTRAVGAIGLVADRIGAVEAALKQS